MRTLPKIGPVAETHHVNGNSLFEFPDNTQSITFGLGCFWGAERRFWEQKGVWSTQAGYAGGGYPNPTYEETCKGASMKNQHAEVVRVVFDPSEVEVGFTHALYKLIIDLAGEPDPSLLGSSRSNPGRSSG